MPPVSLARLARECNVHFGTSGARGLADAMTDQLCWSYTTAFLQEVVSTATRVLVGMDLRPSSPRIARACLAAIRAQGMEPLYAGALPTPALALYALQERIPGVMITGSHIPFDRNGIKFYSPAGEITKDEEVIISAAQVPEATDFTIPLGPVDESALAVYRERFVKFFPNSFLDGWRIGVYQHSGVARDLLCELLTLFGAQVVPLGRTENFVPVDTEAVGEETARQGRLWAAEHRLDALVSTDGDADRPLIGDEQGQWLRGDVAGLLCARYLGARTVVTPVSSNTAIERCGCFDQVIRPRIGSPYVVAGMENARRSGLDGVVGFEANGGFLLANEMQRNNALIPALPTRDAVLPILSLLALAQEKSVPMSGLLADLPPRCTASDRVQDFPTATSKALIKEWAKNSRALLRDLALDDNPALEMDLTDGLRLALADGRIIHIRPSGNAPELRCYAEADSAEAATRLVRESIHRLQSLQRSVVASN
ncbi:MAG: phosphomannomutase [Desulfobulbus sp.]|nr:phosphomannomutase [Desulfobulbus sp.]